MEGTEEPGVGRLLVAFLRFYPRPPLTQAEFGKRSRVAQSDVSDYELGKRVPPEEVLRRMAAAMGVEWPLVVHLRRFYAEVLAAAARLGGNPAEPETALQSAAVDALLLAVSPYLMEKGPAWPERPSPAEARREAEEVWAALAPRSMAERRRLLGFSFRAARSPALAAVICEASTRAAAHDLTEALDLVELALSIAERVEDEGLRRKTEGFCRAFLGNAQRVGNEFDLAEASFARALELWHAGSDPQGLLPEWRLLDLEASLWREQHRFTEALKWLDRARSAPGVDAVAAGRILMKRSHVLERTGDFAGALAELEEATPAIEASGDPHLLFGLVFDMVANLVHLQRWGDAAALLPRVSELGSQQRNELALVRLVWLEARVAAGLGQPDEAIVRLEQVQRDFTKRKLPYDAALASLDLAVLWLDAGRATEVRELAVGMAWIFSAKGIHREAVASLRLFAEAARHDKATAGLARQVIAEIEKVRRAAPPIPKKEGRKV